MSFFAAAVGMYLLAVALSAVMLYAAWQIGKLVWVAIILLTSDGKGRGEYE